MAEVGFKPGGLPSKSVSFPTLTATLQVGWVGETESRHRKELGGGGWGLGVSEAWRRAAAMPNPEGEADQLIYSGLFPRTAPGLQMRCQACKGSPRPCQAFQTQRQAFRGWELVPLILLEGGNIRLLGL